MVFNWHKFLTDIIYQISDNYSHHQIGKDKCSYGDEYDQVDGSKDGVTTAVELIGYTHPAVLCHTDEQGEHG